MLNIAHRQTTAYHPESNGTVERLHRRLKDALRAGAAAATWVDELPYVLLGLRAQPREDTGLSPAESVLELQLSYLTKSYSLMNLLLILLLTIFKKL